MKEKANYPNNQQQQEQQEELKKIDHFLAFRRKAKILGGDHLIGQMGWRHAIKSNNEASQSHIGRSLIR